MNVEMCGNGKIDHEDLEEHEYNACQGITKLIIEENTHPLLWSKTIPFKSLKCLCQVCQDGVLDCPTMNDIYADLMQVIQKHKSQHSRGLIRAVLASDSDDRYTTVKYQMVQSKELVSNSTNIDSNSIVFSDEQVNIMVLFQLS